MKKILDPFILESLNEELRYISNFFSEKMHSNIDFYFFMENKIFEIDKINIKEIVNFDFNNKGEIDLELLKEKIVNYFKIEKNKLLITSYLENTYLIIIFKNFISDNDVKFINKIVSSILIKYIYEYKVNKLNIDIKNLKESLYLREMEINTIYKLEKLFLEENDIEDSIKKILEVTINTLNSDNGSISILEGDSLKFYIISEKSPELLINKKINKNTGIIGKAINEKKTIIVNDVEKSKIWAKDIAKEVDYIPKAIIATPIIAPDKNVIGGIEILHKKDKIQFSKADEILLTIFANQIGRFLYYKNIKK